MGRFTSAGCGLQLTRSTLDAVEWLSKRCSKPVGAVVASTLVEYSAIAERAYLRDALLSMLGL